MRIAAIALLLISFPLEKPARANELGTVLEQARGAIERSDYAAAIVSLERSLPAAQGNGQFLSLLRRAYRGEIQSLVAAGDRAAAQKLLDRLRLIEVESAGAALDDFAERVRGRDPVKVVMPNTNGPDAAVQHQESPHAARSEVPRRSATNAENADGRAGPGAAGPSGWRPSRHKVAIHETPVPGEKTVSGLSKPAARVRAAQPAPQTPIEPTNADRALRRIKQADVLFLARQYLQAGDLYAEAHALAPETMDAAQDRWIYCRLVRAVSVLNGESKPEHRAAIEQDIRAVSARLPDHEFARNLVQLASLSHRSPELAAAPASPVVRASEPEAADLSERGLLAGLAARIGLASSNSTSQSAWKRFRSGRWQVLEASNFRIHATDENLAGQVADIAECTRNELYRTWYGQLPESNWSPKCDIYIHDTADQYARLTRQGPGSPGHSQTGIDRGRIVSRRIDLRRDGPDLVHAILPHEVTHVVLADRFSSKPMPRWADEGMAVLTEPVEKKEAHLRNLHDIARRGRLFSARQLMTMNDYPSGEQWPMFYAQSVSLVDFLVSRSGPARFVEFMQRSLEVGYESELKRVYGLASFEELDREWTRGRNDQVATIHK